jgi:hypothetical protein
MYIDELSLVSHFSRDDNKVPHVTEVVCTNLHRNFCSMPTGFFRHEAESSCHVVDGSSILFTKFPLLEKTKPISRPETNPINLFIP